MGEFASEVRQHAAETIRQEFSTQPSPEADPLVELVSFLLEDGAGGVDAPHESPVTTDQWLAWNAMAMDRPRELTLALTVLVEREQMTLPAERARMRTWAAQLLVMTLDELTMR